MLSSPHSERRGLLQLLSGIEGLSLIALDRQLHVVFATPSAHLLGGVQEHGHKLQCPPSLMQAISNALESKADQLSWQTTHAGHARMIEIHLSPMTNSKGEIDGHVLMMLDVAAGTGKEEKLRRLNAIFRALVSCNSQLNAAESWQQAMPEVLAHIGTTAGLARVHVFRKLLEGDQTSRLTRVLQWDAPDAPKIGDDVYEELPISTRWLQSLRHREAVLGTGTHFPPSEQAILHRRHTQAIALVPVFSGQAWWGVISFERCHENDNISPEKIGALATLGESLGAAIRRQDYREHLQQARIALNCTAEGIMSCDAQNRITSVNKSFTAITGYTEEEVIGRTPAILRSDRHKPDFFAAMWHDIAHQGGWHGEVWNRRKNGEIYPQRLTIATIRNDGGEISHYVAVFADVSELKQSQQRLHDLVNHDPLTGLPNRRLLNELLEHAVKHAEREHSKIALLFVDLDRFKTINDTLGHHAGDMLLASATHRLISSVRECDTVSRLGGDEFVIMMNGLRENDDAAIVAKKIIAALQESFIIDGKELFIGASVGISIYPQDGLTSHDLIKAADIAMYQVKHEGRNNFSFYTSRLGETAHERLNMDTMLRHALERSQLVVHYQPQISLQTGSIIGAEALLRWNHPELGMIPPGKFIPLAEETGLIIPIGEWVLRQAATDLLRLHKAGYQLQRISVNVSATQLHRSNFADTVYGVLVETGCEPEQLELEITESAIMNNVEYVIEVCRRLKDMGVKLALDDFGTGYSSLSYLKRFPLDKLKIDQSFVRELPYDPDDMAISSAIIGLGRNLGLTVIAEGVEKTEQETFLQEKGCQEAQGYLYSRPISFAALLELLTTRNPATQ